MHVRLRVALVACLGAGLVLPSAAPAGLNGKWRVGPLLDVQIAFIKGGTRGIALNNVSACKVKKGDDVWRIKKGANGAIWPACKPD